MIFGMKHFKMNFMGEGASGGGAGGEPTGGTPATGEPAGGTPATGEPAGGIPPANGEPAGEIKYNYPEGLDSSYHGNQTLLKYADDKGNFKQAEVYKALIHATSAIGADKMLVPNKNFTEEQWTDTYRKLGVPEKIEDYKIQNNLPNGMEANDNLMTEFTALSHKLGMRPSQAQSVLDFYNQFAGNELTRQNQTYTDKLGEDTANLKAEWGNGYEKNMNLANQALNHFYPDQGAREALTNTGFLDTVEGTKFFQKLGSNLSEEHFTPEGQGGFGSTNEELDSQISTVSQELITLGKQHPQYQAKLAQYQNVLNKRHGTRPIAPTSGFHR